MLQSRVITSKIENGGEKGGDEANSARMFSPLMEHTRDDVLLIRGKFLLSGEQGGGSGEQGGGSGEQGGGSGDHGGGSGEH